MQRFLARSPVVRAAERLAVERDDVWPLRPLPLFRSGVRRHRQDLRDRLHPVGKTGCELRRIQVGEDPPKRVPTVSCAGMPCGRSRNVANHSALIRPNSAISTQLSAPPITPHSAIVTMASNECARARATRGSSKAAKCSSTAPIRCDPSAARAFSSGISPPFPARTSAISLST
jgi:hypothetical protein